MSDALDAMFPIGSVRDEIEKRWTQIADQLFQELEEHVAAKNPNEQSVRTYQATFQATSKANSGRTVGKKGVRASRWFRLQVEKLEHAVAWCVAAKRLEPKALANMLAAARTCCSRFDQLVHEERAALAECHIHRVRGGRNRQARLDPVREFARILSERDRPAVGWKSLSAAARAIAPEVGRFIRARGVSMQADDFLPQTIARWLRKDSGDLKK